MKKALMILGVIVLLGGVALIIVSHYIMRQVEEGKIEITEGEEKIQKSEQLFSLNPYTKEIGKGLTASGKHKIAKGKIEVDKYTRLAEQLKTGGIILIVGGAVLIFLGFLVKKKKC